MEDRNLTLGAPGTEGFYLYRDEVTGGGAYAMIGTDLVGEGRYYCTRSAFGTHPVTVFSPQFGAVKSSYDPDATRYIGVKRLGLADNIAVFSLALTRSGYALKFAGMPELQVSVLRKEQKYVVTCEDRQVALIRPALELADGHPLRRYVEPRLLLLRKGVEPLKEVLASLPQLVF